MGRKGFEKEIFVRQSILAFAISLALPLSVYADKEAQINSLNDENKAKKKKKKKIDSMQVELKTLKKDTEKQTRELESLRAKKSDLQSKFSALSRDYNVLKRTNTNNTTALERDGEKLKIKTEEFEK